MEITNFKLKDIKPYEKNPRKNDEAVEFVANSIKEFTLEKFTGNKAIKIN